MMNKGINQDNLTEDNVECLIDIKFNVDNCKPSEFNIWMYELSKQANNISNCFSVKQTWV